MDYFQDRMPYNRCWGCGADNPDGLHLKSRWEGEGLAVCLFRSDRPLWAGPTEVLNGGIIGVLVDCHGVCTAIADAYLREDRPIGSAPILWSVTARLEVDYQRPVPWPSVVRVEARVAERSGRKARVDCRLSVEGQVCASGRVLAVSVPGEWLRQRGGHHPRG